MGTFETEEQTQLQQDLQTFDQQKSGTTVHQQKEFASGG